MLPHILNGTSKYLYHFQRVTTRYHQIFKKGSILLLFFIKLTVTHGNPVENGTKYVLIHFKMQSNMNSNTSDIAQKKGHCVEYCKNCLL